MVSKIFVPENSLISVLELIHLINHEFNVDANAHRAAQLALEWAVAYAEMDAGLLGMVEGEDIQLLASVGYELESNTIEDRHFLRWVLNNNAPRCCPFGLLAEVQGGCVIPLCFREQIVGVMLLESETARRCSDDVLTALVQLGMHIAIIIAVARLEAEVQETQKSGTEFISFVAHELRAPMTSIKGYASMVASGMAGELSEMQAKFIGTIQSNVDRMAGMVANLSDVNKIEAGRLHLETRAEPLDRVVEEAVAPLRDKIEAKKQSLSLEIADDLPKVWGDRARLSQVIANLVDNAHKYAPEETEITVHAVYETASNMVQIAVCDEGYGIGEENRRKIFTKFFRSDDSKVRATPGNGLGLHVSKRLVELQGGKIWFESEYREGSTFYFTIPAVSD